MLEFASPAVQPTTTTHVLGIIHRRRKAVGERMNKVVRLTSIDTPYAESNPSTVLCMAGAHADRPSTGNSKFEVGGGWNEPDRQIVRRACFTSVTER